MGSIEKKDESFSCPMKGDENAYQPVGFSLNVQLDAIQTKKNIKRKRSTKDTTGIEEPPSKTYFLTVVVTSNCNIKLIFSKIFTVVF